MIKYQEVQAALAVLIGAKAYKYCWKFRETGYTEVVLGNQGHLFTETSILPWNFPTGRAGRSPGILPPILRVHFWGRLPSFWMLLAVAKEMSLLFFPPFLLWVFFCFSLQNAQSCTTMFYAKKWESRVMKRRQNAYCAVIDTGWLGPT